MTSLERARRFLENKGRVIALTVVPLASLVALAMPAKAGSLLPSSLTFSGSSCIPGASGGTTSGTCSLSTPTSSVSAGVSDGIHITATGGVQETATVAGTDSLILTANGFANGVTLDELLPVDWNFSVASSISSDISYSLVYTLKKPGTLGEGETGITTLVPLTSVTETGTISSGSGTAAGFDSLNVDGEVSGYSIVLTLSQSEAVGNTMTVTIPDGSLDINTEATAPEPASVLLGGSGLLAVLLSRFRRKNA